MKVTAEIAKRVGEDGGGALIVDYGDDKLVSDSLQVFLQTTFLHECYGTRTPCLMFLLSSSLKSKHWCVGLKEHQSTEG
jgi:hypothetical protein